MNEIQLIKARVRSYDVKEYPNDYSKKDMWEHLKLFVAHTDRIEAQNEKYDANLRIFAMPLETIGDYS